MYKKAKEAFIEVVGGKKLTLDETNEIVEAITEKMDPEADVIWKARIDNKMGDKIKITTLLTF